MINPLNNDQIRSQLCTCHDSSLSWHVKNYDLAWSLESKLGQRKHSQDFNLSAHEYFVKRVLDPLNCCCKNTQFDIKQNIIFSLNSIVNICYILHKFLLKIWLLQKITQSSFMHIDGSVEDCSVSIANALETLQSCINSLWPRDAIRWHRSGSTLAQVMACCLTAPSHYLNQCWLIISYVVWHSPDGDIHWKCWQCHSLEEA